MAYGAISEFPHGTMWEGDLSELIHLYKKLTGQYHYLCEEINKLNVRFANLERTMNSRIAESIKKALDAYTAKWDAEVQVLSGKIGLLAKKMKDEFDYRDSQRLDDLKKIYSMLANMDAKIDELNTSLNSKIDSSYSSLKTELAAVRLSNIQDITTAKNEFRAGIADINARIDELPKTIGVINNPFTGELAPAGDVVNDLYNLGINSGGFSAMDWYASTYITAGVWNDSDITALEFYTNGRERLKMIERKDYLFSPVTGKFVKPSQAIIDLAKWLNVYGTTAGWYDSAEITAGEYDEQELSAGEYDTETGWHQHFIQRFMEGE